MAGKPGDIEMEQRDGQVSATGDNSTALDAFKMEIGELRDLMELRGPEAVHLLAENGGVKNLCKRLHTCEHQGM